MLGRVFTLGTGAAIGIAVGFGPSSLALAQSGALERAVGGYSFEEAAKEDPDTKNFHSNDGVLTFAIVTHTAGNGFFDPVYVGATVAANLIGAKVLLLGSESPTDDPAREIEILNQIIRTRLSTA
jgi:simple sugar transport system substrate-binding protein